MEASRLSAQEPAANLIPNGGKIPGRQCISDL